MNHWQSWKSCKRSGKNLNIRWYSSFSWLDFHNILAPTILTFIITISDTSKNQPKRLDSDNEIKVSRLIVYCVTCLFKTSADVSTAPPFTLISVLFFSHPKRVWKTEVTIYGSVRVFDFSSLIFLFWPDLPHRQYVKGLVVSKVFKDYVNEYDFFGNITSSGGPGVAKC